MGSTFASDLAEGIGGITLEQSISIHLTSNHCPPVPTSMVAPCITAIKLINGGFPDALIELPEGVEWRDQSKAPAWAIADAHHLGAWLEGED